MREQMIDFKELLLNRSKPRQKGVEMELHSLKGLAYCKFYINFETFSTQTGVIVQLATKGSS